MKGKGERGNRDRGLSGKRKGGRGFLAKWPSSSSLPRFRTEGGGGRDRAAAGLGGRGRRRSRPWRRPGSGSKWRGGPGESIPRAHLVLGWSEEAAPREGGGSAAVLRGGGAVELRGRGVRSLWRCEAGRDCRTPFSAGKAISRPGSEL
jgi:hypothetical protein